MTPSGDFAAFGSTLAPDRVDNAGHTQVYRYDTPADRLDCVSCAPTLATATGDGTSRALGLGLSDDGRVFFNSTEPLAPRDSRTASDVYEWENGRSG